LGNRIFTTSLGSLLSVASLGTLVMARMSFGFTFFRRGEQCSLQPAQFIGSEQTQIPAPNGKFAGTSVPSQRVPETGIAWDYHRKTAGIEGTEGLV